MQAEFLQETASGEVLAGPGQYLTFSVRGERYALRILDVREILEVDRVTPVPLMPDAVRGVINLRGLVVPVIDLGARFGGGRSDILRRSCIVIVDVPGDGAAETKGVLVDAVHAVIEVTVADLQRRPSFGAGIRADFIEAVASIGGHFIIILAPGAVLSNDELAAASSAMRAAGLAVN